MHIGGTLDRILADTLPHEVMHTILAAHFRKPLPRWADEGIALQAESPEEQERHQPLARYLLASGSRRTLKLANMLGMRDYPKDTSVFFAQSYSIARFLVERKDRP